MSEHDAINIENIPQNVLQGCFEEDAALYAERIAYLESNVTQYRLLGANNEPKGYILQENDGELQNYIDDRIEFFKSRYDSISPLNIAGWKDWNQRSNGSCTSMGGTHAAQATQGFNYLFGTPLTYTNWNPLYLYMYGKGFRYSDGENLWKFAKNMVEVGNSPVYLAGEDCVSRNITRAMWEKTNAAQYQTSICSLSRMENVVRFLQAGFGIMFGSNYIPTAINESGDVTKATSGAHCMALCGWDYRREMPWYQNSWGNSYINRQSGGFIKRSSLERFNIFGRFGNPIAMIATEFKLALLNNL